MAVLIVSSTYALAETSQTLEWLTADGRNSTQLQAHPLQGDRVSDFHVYTTYPLNIRDHCFGYPTRLLYFILSFQSIHEVTDRLSDNYKLASLYFW
jgi:hypothetical protein